MNALHLRLVAPAALLALAACGGKDMPIDPEAVSRYAAYDFDPNAPAGVSGGGGQTIDLSAVNRGAAVPGGTGGAFGMGGKSSPVEPAVPGYSALSV